MMKKVKQKCSTRWLDISICILVLSVLFFYVNVLMMSGISANAMMDLVSSNPIIGSDVLSACGKIFSILVLIKLRQKIQGDQDDSSYGIAFIVLCAAQLCVQNYLCAVALFLFFYKRYYAQMKLVFSLSLCKQNLASFSILVLHVFILFVNLRIQAIV